jgi:hypothetical protein
LRGELNIEILAAELLVEVFRGGEVVGTYFGLELTLGGVVLGLRVANEI